MRLALVGSLLLFVAAVFSSRMAVAERLSGPELGSFIAGKRVYLKVPLGGEFPLYYSPSGKVDGSGESVGLGRFLKPNDSGRWWVAGDRLCQKWSSWYDGKPFCFVIEKTGDDTIAWKREDGYSGTARVGE